MAGLDITRNLGESEPDFRRRYCREKMRIYRARKPKGPRKVRGKGKGPLVNSLLTHEQWVGLQQREGESEVDWKRRAGRERMKIWRKRDPEKARAASREWHNSHLASEKARNARYRAENAEKIKAQQRAYCAANKKRRNAAFRAWLLANPERRKESAARWREANRALCASYSAAWRKAAREQTPPWADFDKILAVYEEARRLTLETGEPHHVDHWAPLRGKTVSGLHVHTNLRVIPGAENVRKHNRFDLDSEPPNWPQTMTTGVQKPPGL